MRILMCRPDFYGIEYEINPWMNLKHKVDHQAALQQWEALYQTILTCGAEVDLIQPISGWPDMVFTANAALPYRNKIILSRFKYPERQGEVPYFQAWFQQKGYEIINPLQEETNPAFFEGAGDALFAGDTLFAAYGFRTDHQFYKAPYFNQDQLVFCELTDPYFYHLDTCFCPLNNNLAICYPPAFSLITQKNISSHLELLIVNEEEAKHFACNAVVLDNQVILPAHTPIISEELKKRGFIVHHCLMDEYLKAGGACKCLTLKLD